MLIERFHETPNWNVRTFFPLENWECQNFEILVLGTLSFRLGIPYLAETEIFFVKSAVNKVKMQLKWYSETHKQYQKMLRAS